MDIENAKNKKSSAAYMHGTLFLVIRERTPYKFLTFFPFALPVEEDRYDSGNRPSDWPSTPDSGT